MASVTDWFEVYGPGLDPISSFYGTAFGWQVQQWDQGDYTMFAGPNGPFAGLMDLNTPQMEGVPPHWGTYFHTDDCAATVDKATSLGAAVVYGPMTVDNVGTMAGLTDPTGAFFNVMQPAGERMDNSNCPVNWVEQNSSDRATAVQFYKDLFGWGSNDLDMGDGVGVYTLFTLGEESVGGCGQASSDQQPAAWTVYFGSTGLEDSIKAVTDAGGSIMMDVMDIGQFGRIAIAADVNGAVFGLHQPPAM